MNFSKRKLYVLVLLLLIIFVSISFSLIINIREGLCLPSCDNVKIDPTNVEIPDCSPTEIKMLQSNDASKIESEIIIPFIKTIDNKIKLDYSYHLIETLYNTPTQNEKFIVKKAADLKMKSYFTDFSNNITLQDKMDNLVLNISEIETNLIFKDNIKKDEILKSLKKYQDERKTAFIEIYKKFLKDIEPYGNGILIDNECSKEEKNKNYYKDENFKQLIKGEIKNPVYYGDKSSFHNINNYLQQAIQGKLGEVSPPS